MYDIDVINERELERRFGANGEHPELGRDDWRDAVATRATICGYWTWVACVLERKLNPDWEEPS